MKTAQWVFMGVLIILLTLTPVVADAHGGFGGGAVLGFGLGLFTGFAFAPRPVYVGPVYPAYYYTPPPVVYRYYPAPTPPDPSVNRYSNRAEAANPPPAGQSRCREWRLLNRHWEDRWDSYYGRWRPALVEKWGWASIPCRD